MPDEGSHFGQNGKNAARSAAAAGSDLGDGIGVASAQQQPQDFGAQEPGGCRAPLADELQNATHGLTAFAGGRLGFVAVGLVGNGRDWPASVKGGFHFFPLAAKNDGSQIGESRLVSRA